MQYKIVLVNLNPTKGSEMKKTRPCIILSPDEMNHNLNTVIIAPLTSTYKNYPTRVPIKHNNKKGSVVLDQLRTIDKSRIIERYNLADSRTIKEIKSVLNEMLIL